MIKKFKKLSTSVLQNLYLYWKFNNNRGTEERWSSFVMFVNHSMIHWYCGTGWNKIAFNNNNNNNNNNNLLILISEQVQK